MKKGLKIAGITLASLVGVLLITLSVLFWFVLTPSRLTPFVKKQAARFITCTVNLDRVELTFFKTFPDIGLEIDRLQLVNPFPGAPSDTLINVEKAVISLNIRALLKDKDIVVNQFHLNRGSVAFFVNPEGEHNFNVFVKDTTSDEGFTFREINLDKVRIEEVKANYTDLHSGIHAETERLSAKVKGKIRDKSVDGDLQLSTGKLLFALPENDLSAALSQLNVSAKGGMKKDLFSGDFSLETGAVGFSYREGLSVLASLDKLQTEFKGTVRDWNEIDGELQLTLDSLTGILDSVEYIRSGNFAFNLPLHLMIDRQWLDLEKASVAFNEYLINIDGNLSLSPEAGDIGLDLDLNTDPWEVKEILAMIPDTLKGVLQGYNLDGVLALKAKVNGVYNDSLYPAIYAGIVYNNGKISIPSFPLALHDVNADIGATIDLNGTSRLQIASLSAATGTSHIRCSGAVEDLFNRMLCHLNIQGDIALAELQPLFPKTLQLKGGAKADLKADFTVSQLVAMDLEKMKVAGTVDIEGADIRYNDSLFITSPYTHVDLVLPSPNRNKDFHELVSAKIEATALEGMMIDLFAMDAQNVKMDVAISDFLDTTKVISATCDFDLEKAGVKVDTIFASVQHPRGSFVMYPSAKNPKSPLMNCSYQHDAISADMGKSHSVSTRDLALKAQASYDNEQKNVLLQWSPKGSLRLQKGVFKTTLLSQKVEIPAIRLDFAPERIEVEESRIVLGNSKFDLSGLVTHLDSYLNNTGLLKADLKFISERTDINQLMDIFNGFGNDSASVAAAGEPADKEDNPFMVPKGIDVSLYTLIKRATVGQTVIENVEGLFTVKDGIMVLEQMGFTNEAARMQLTALYKSPRKNHLFAGIDFHLLDIDIAKLIDMIPVIDTIVPMLKSFEGKAEFHFAIETNLTSGYDIKFSTLRGAAAISGQNLVLLDNETFAMISKKLLFKKRTKNIVDSLSVEMTLYKDEVDLYPFLIVMDKYKAVVSGRHNLDKTYNYHISITETPFWIRLGLNVKGKPEKMKFRLVPCKYKRLFHPDKQGVVEKETLMLKDMIHESLRANVKDQPPHYSE